MKKILFIFLSLVIFEGVAKKAAPNIIPDGVFVDSSLGESLTESQLILVYHHCPWLRTTKKIGTPIQIKNKKYNFNGTKWVKVS